MRRGEEAFFDSMILGPTIASLDAYRPEAITAGDSYEVNPIGDAFTDKCNPVRKIFSGERLDLWSLKKPVRSDVPPGAKHPIDAFIQS